jgi:hypothetical protein
MSHCEHCNFEGTREREICSKFRSHKLRRFRQNHYSSDSPLRNITRKVVSLAIKKGKIGRKMLKKHIYSCIYYFHIFSCDCYMQLINKVTFYVQKYFAILDLWSTSIQVNSVFKLVLKILL